MITFVAAALCGLHVIAWLVSPSSPREEVMREHVVHEGTLETSMA
jgi:hypothetical protein